MRLFFDKRSKEEVIDFENNIVIGFSKSRPGYVTVNDIISLREDGRKRRVENAIFITIKPSLTLIKKIMLIILVCRKIWGYI